MPPFFPDLDECHRCVGRRGIREAAVQQRVHFWPASTSAATTKKFEAGAAAFREKLEARKKDLFREDRETAQRFASQLAVTHQEALMALATTLVAQTERLRVAAPLWPAAGGLRGGLELRGRSNNAGP